MGSDAKTILVATVVVTALLGGAHYWYRLEQQKLVVNAITNTTKTLNASVQASSAQLAKAAVERQPEWITIAGRSKDECIKVSGGVLNNAYVRCRDGWQEKVVYRDGRKVVLQERAIPSGRRL